MSVKTGTPKISTKHSNERLNSKKPRMKSIDCGLIKTKHRLRHDYVTKNASKDSGLSTLDFLSIKKYLI